MGAILTVRNLKTHFPIPEGIVRAVDDVSMEINENEIVGLVGESGSGKSTLGFSILDMVPTPGRIVSGEILFRGRNLIAVGGKGMRNIRGKEISMVFQDPFTYLNPTMRIKDQIVEAITEHQGKTKEEGLEIAVKILDDVQISSPRKILNRFPNELSGGMLQRVLISIAISCSPSIIIADEPTTALDATVQRQILNLLENLKSEHRISILLITHDLGIVAEICDRVYVMYAGTIFEQGDIFSLFGEPRNPYTQGLLASVLSIDQYKEKLYTIEGEVPNMLEPPNGCKFHPRCSFCMEICKEEEPPLFREPSRSVRCWLYKEDGSC